MHFGLRGRQEHRDMKVENLSFQNDDGGFEFIIFAEGLTKTRGGGLRVKSRLATPKMFATGEKRCPVALLKKYSEKRPAELKTTGPLYLGVIENQKPSCGTRRHPWGKTP